MDILYSLQQRGLQQQNWLLNVDSRRRLHVLLHIRLEIKLIVNLFKKLHKNIFRSNKEVAFVLLNII